MRARLAIAAVISAAVLTIPSRSLAADDAAPPAPFASSQSAPAAPEKAPPKSSPAVVLTPAPPKPNPAAAEIAPPAAAQVVTLHLLAAPAPPPVAQPITLRVVADPPANPPAPAPVALQLQTLAPAAPTPAAATSAPLVGELRHAGPFRRALGNFGARLQRAGYDRVLIAPQAQMVAVQAAPQVVVMQPAAVQTVLATPQSPGPKCKLLGLCK